MAAKSGSLINASKALLLNAMPNLPETQVPRIFSQQ
jgi:hypothetical protein